MATGHALKLLALAALTGTLTACVTPGKAEPPPGVDLAGPWKLDRSASDDPQREIDKLREYLAKAAARRRSAPAPVLSGRGLRRGPDQQEQADQAAADAVVRGSQGEFLATSNTMQELTAFIARGDYLMVRQEPGNFALQYGSTRRSFTPGAHSVVSSERGVADQVSGWKGNAYVIDVRPQVGPGTTEEYSLSDDKRRLIVKLHVGAGELPAVDLKEVYGRASEVGPRAVPTNE